VPLFHSSYDAMIARLRNFGLLLFKPVVLDARFLKEIVPLPGEDEVDFCMVVDPFASLNCGSPIERTEVALLMRCSDEHQNVPRKGITFHLPGLCTLLKVTAKQLRLGRMMEARTQSVREVA
jgi:hypothetical protein